MSLVRSYIKALMAHLWPLMSCAVFTLLGMAFLATNATNKTALRITFGAAGLMFLVASFLAWRDEREARTSAEGRANEFQTGTGQTEATVTHWEHIRYRFENLANRGLVAYIANKNGDYEIHASGGNKNDRLEAEALCANAGMLLVRSPAVFAAAPDYVKNESDSFRRWVLWIVHKHQVEVNARGHLEDGSPWEGRKIEDLIRSSSIACTECLTSISTVS